MGKTIRIALGVALVLAAVSAAGCSQIAERATKAAVEKTTGVKVDEKSDQVTVTGKDGKSVTFTGGEKKLPDNLPKDFPVYEGTPNGGGSAESEEGSTFSFTILTSDSVKTVFEWYKKELVGNGWKIENSATVSADGNDTGSITTKKGTSEAIVTIGMDSSNGDKVTISVIINQKKG